MAFIRVWTSLSASVFILGFLRPSAASPHQSHLQSDSVWGTNYIKYDQIIKWLSAGTNGMACIFLTTAYQKPPSWVILMWLLCTAVERNSETAHSLTDLLTEVFSLVHSLLCEARWVEHTYTFVNGFMLQNTWTAEYSPVSRLKGWNRKLRVFYYQISYFILRVNVE